MTWIMRLLGMESGADVSRIVESAWYNASPLSSTSLGLLIALGVVLASINLLPWLALRTNVRFITFVLRICMVLVLIAAFQRLEWHGTLALQEPQQWQILVDDSASMATRDAQDGKSRFDAARKDLAEIERTLNGRVKLEVSTVSGQPLGDTPGSGPTPLAAAITRSALARVRPNRLLVLTDGRDSDDRDLATVGEELKLRDTRLAVVMVGSRSTPTDSGLTAEPDRSIIRLGEELVIQGSVYGAAGETQVTLKENGKEVKKIEVSAPTDSKVAAKNRRFEIRHRPKEKGQHLYTLELPTNDAAAANNVTRFTVRVVEERINVLLLEGFPRFEFKLFKGVLEVDPLVNLVCVSQVPGGGVYVQGEPLHKNAEQGLIASQAELFKYDVVILRDVPRNLFRAGGDTSESRLRMLVEFVTKRGGGLMVCGGQDVFRAGGYEDSSLAEVLPFDLSDHFSGDAQFEGMFFADVASTAHDHPLLRLLPDAGDNRTRWNNMPKLDGSNNVGRFKPLAMPLLTRIAKIKTKADVTEDRVVPILGAISVGEGKVLGASVDTLWRWQLQPDFEDPPLTMLLANAMRYLAPPPGRKPDLPLVALSDPTPQVGQEVVLSTDLRDANFDPIRNAELAVTVTRPDNTTLRILPRDLPEELGHYSYRVPLDQPGPYKVLAKYGKFESTREFLAGAAAGEFTDLSADADRMQRFTKAAGGELITTSVRDWLHGADLNPAERLSKRELEVWNSPLMLLLFVMLVSLDCYVRKRQGLA